MNRTVQHEEGKSDVIADDNSIRQVPEGTGEKEADKNDGGFINGKPATKEQVRRSTQPS
jgi:hypothetical protein